MCMLKYPKFFLLLFTVLLAYFIFAERDLLGLTNLLSRSGYFGVFLAGFFFAYAFTAAPATAILLILAKEQNFLFTGLIAGLGALIADLLIFKFIRYSFKDEIKKFSREKIVKNFNHKIPKLIKKYVILVLAGFIIASPLPDEIGVALFAASTSVSTRLFSIFSYVMNTSGIFVILLIGRII